MKKILEKMKEKRLQFEKWLNNNKDKPFMFFLRLIPSILFMAILIGNSCQNEKTALAEDLITRSTYNTVLFNTNAKKLADDSLRPSIVPNGVSSSQYLLESFYFTLDFRYNVAKPSVTLTPAGYGYTIKMDVESGDLTIVDKYVPSTSLTNHNTAYLVSYQGLNLSSLSSLTLNSYSERYVDVSTSDYSSTLFGLKNYGLPTSSSKALYIYEWRMAFLYSDKSAFYITFDVPIFIDGTIPFTSRQWTMLFPSSNSTSDGYNEGLSDGLQQGKNIGFTDGYNKGLSDGDSIGYNRGYNEGLQVSVGDVTPLQALSNNVSAILRTEIFPGFRLSSIIMISITCFLVVVLLKSFASL